MHMILIASKMEALLTGLLSALSKMYNRTTIMHLDTQHLSIRISS